MGDGPNDALWIVAEGASPEVYDWRTLAIVTLDDPEDMDHSSSSPVTMSERDANARLIAAAPEMFEALEKARNFFVGEPFQAEARDCLASIEAALAKATGAA